MVTEDFHPFYFFYLILESCRMKISFQIFLFGAEELRLLSCAYKHRLKRQNRWETSASVGALTIQAHRAGPRPTQYKNHSFSSLPNFLFPSFFTQLQPLLIHILEET